MGMPGDLPVVFYPTTNGYNSDHRRGDQCHDDACDGVFPCNHGLFHNSGVQHIL